VTRKGTQFFRLQKTELSELFELTSKGVQKNSAEKIPEAENRAQRAQLAQLMVLPQTACEKCGKIGCYMIVRETGNHYLCEKCLRDWEGNL